MNKRYFLVLFGFMFMFSLSCNTAKESGHTENVKDTVQEYERIQILDNVSSFNDFPAVSLFPPPDRVFRSIFFGKVVDSFFQKSEFDIFEDRLVIQIDENYVLYNEEQKITYFIMIFDLEKMVTDGATIELGDVLGRVHEAHVKMLAFSETLDPYLIINSSRIPVFYAGYYWFDPSFLASTGNTRFLSFNPVDNIDIMLTEMADHIIQETPGLAIYNERVRFKSKLSLYPQAITQEQRSAISGYENIVYGRTGIIGHINEIKTGGFSYYLCWQNGFNEYLRREYTLNNDIWLYGIIVTYDVLEKRAYIFLRDFTPVSLEEIYQGRMEELRKL